MRLFRCFPWLLVPVVLLALACGPELTPEEKIEVLRSHYTAELKSLTVKQDPAPSAVLDEEGEDGEDAAEALVAGVTTEVILDILVSTNSDEHLDGITLDLLQQGGDGEEKDRRTLWVDTSQIVRGSGSQITHVLTDVDYEPMDGFFVEVRVPIPESERSAYSEFLLP